MTRATLSARSVLAVAIGLPVAAMLIATVAPVVGGRIGGPPAGSALRNADSGLCLAVDADGAPALAPCTGGEDQLWRRLTGGAGTVSLMNAGTGRCLAAVAGDVSTPFCAAGDRAQSLSAAGEEGYAAADGSGSPASSGISAAAAGAAARCWSRRAAATTCSAGGRADPPPPYAARVLMLLDSASLYFRAFHGVPESVTADDGTPVNAVRGFIDMVAFLVRERRPDRITACLDLDWRPAFRVAAVPSYKSHRIAPAGGEDVPAGLVPQVPILLDVLAKVGIAAVGSPGFEADDVIGTLAAAATGPVEVVSGDRDLFQVVRADPPVHVLYVGKGVRNLEVMGEDEVAAKYGIPGRNYADFAVLRGDPSDGLPGVKGVGEKSAAALVTKFGSLDAMVAALDSDSDAGFPSGSRTKLAAARDYLAAAPAVARVRTDAPVPAHDDALPAEPVDPAGLVELSERWNLDAPLNRLLAALKAVTS